MNKIFSKFIYLFVLFFAVVLTYYLSESSHVSKSNLDYLNSDLKKIRAVVSVLQHGEKFYPSPIFEQLGCDVYETFYPQINSNYNEINNPMFFANSEDSQQAKDLIAESLKVLKDFNDRHGEKTCDSANIILDWN